MIDSTVYLCERKELSILTMLKKVPHQTNKLAYKHDSGVIVCRP